MRFLLHASKKTKSIKSPGPVPVNSQSNTRKAWGQQCSPNCGCVIRFESNIDSDGKIVSATYQAKTVLTSFQNGRLEPQYTTNNQKPLLVKCGCDTLHHLATGVTQHVSGRRLDQIRNLLTGGCSSPAVIHTVLKAQQLNTRDTHCFQVVEQAVVAMVCGYVPSLHHVSTRNLRHCYYHDEDYTSSVEEIISKSEPQIKETTTTTLTWEAYVDEMYHQYDVERSA